MLLFTIKLTGLPDFSDNERRLAAYILDAVHNGHWFVQTDASMEVASKPPLLTWLASLAVLPSGKISRFALYWPSAISTIAIALLLFSAGTRIFSSREGLCAASVYMLSYTALQQMEMPRYDALLALFTTAGALAAFNAWESGHGWTQFWTANAMGTLVKGPLALLLSSGGLIMRLKECGQCRLSRNHWGGIIIYTCVTGAWLGLAYWQMGPALIDKMVHRELIGHAIGGYKEGREWFSYFEPCWNFLRSFAPWSILTVLAMMRQFRSGRGNSRRDCFELFVSGWLVIGLIIFSLGSHQRTRLIFPLVPAAALLAGIELSRRAASFPTRHLVRIAWGGAVLFLVGTTLHSHFLLRRSRRTQETLAAINLVEKLEGTREGQFPFTYLDLWHPLQVAASTRQNAVSSEAAIELLNGELPAFVVARTTSATLTNACTREVYTVFRWPAEGSSKYVILSNHPRLEWTASLGVSWHDLRIEIINGFLVHASESHVTVAPAAENVDITILNEGQTDRWLTINKVNERPGTGHLVRIPAHCSKPLKQS